MKRVFATALLASLAWAASGRAQAPVCDAEFNPWLQPEWNQPELMSPDVEPLQLTLPPTTPPANPAPSACDEVGYSLPATPDIKDALDKLRWKDMADGTKAARIELTSANAFGLRVRMTDSGRLLVRVYDPATMAAFGPYTYPRLDDDGSWMTTVIFGPTIGLEFVLAPGAPMPTLPRIVSIMHLYTDFANPEGGGPPVGTCDPDLRCDATWFDSIEDFAVGYMLFDCTTSSCGQCTGAMLNRSPSDIPTGSVSPTFMTARHCVGTQSSANSLIVIWRYRNTTCNGAAPNLNTLPRNDGSLLLKTTLASEWTLLGLYQRDQTSNYAGWDANFLSNGSSVTGIHHGAGQPKRICTGTKVGATSCLGAANEWEMEYTNGRTIPGASGSPFFDSGRRVRGTLSCDNRLCPPDQGSSYGRLDTAFSRVGVYLFNMANPSFASVLVGGDSGNDGTSETGASGNPFNTVYEATFCVPTNGTVNIVPSATTYNERFRLWRPMTLRRSGTSGVVTIGR